MVYKTFAIALIWRFVVLELLMLATAWLAIKPGFYAGLVIAIIILLIASIEFWQFIKKTNREISRFLDAARYSDFSQRFEFKNLGGGFRSLGETFTDILENLRQLRSQQEADLRRLKALVEHVPVPLISVHGNGSVTLQNNAARRLFGSAPISHVRDLMQFGSGFHRAVTDAVPGNKQLVVFAHDGMEQQMTLSATEVIVANERELLVSLQDIQSELDTMQTESWQDLVRVLTHEIMNSITPISSLTRTASDLADDVLKKVDDKSPLLEDLTDIHHAVATVSRRSESLMQFVDSYRQLTRLAPPERFRVPLASLFEYVADLAKAEWGEQSVALVVTTTPQSLDVYADRDLVEPVLLNLLRNAWQATQSLPTPKIMLSARLNRRGRVVIEVDDNGPGIAKDIAQKIFVPFFTTKEGGSGVGLALTRQVMIAHHGFVTAGTSNLGGAKFSLIF